MVLNTDLRILTVNQAFTTSFKLSQEEVDGNFLYEIGNGMFDLPVLREQLRKMTVKNTWVQDFGLEHSFPGLGNKNLLINAMRMSGDNGKNPRILLAIEDITEGSTAKRALFVSEDGLREAQSRLAVALEAAQMGFWDIDLRGNILKRSPRFDQLLRLDPDLSHWDIRLAGQHLLAEDRLAFTESLGRVGEDGRINFSGRVQHEDGIRQIRLFGKMFTDGERRPIRASGVIFDITDQHNMEE
jgi:PAS domain-containing protein